ncbi:hypothetical protein [Lactococcus termiticola]|uniref:Uncharacterized protein n=1 Tax=Lactococcus termiticola TaxID=2169526 RepID=A0A2R5HCS7_9LACT|nr:hypothetical protein [Lactococcus termiticola]GBG95899.1 hypothetical protein NtB2_00001 [Lactococcus termiticola]
MHSSKEIIETTEKILKDNFWDNEFGGVYAANDNYNTPVTLEKKILDQAYTLLYSFSYKNEILYDIKSRN